MNFSVFKIIMIEPKTAELYSIGCNRYKDHKCFVAWMVR